MNFFNKVRRNWLRYFASLFFIGLVIVGLEIFQPFINTSKNAGSATAYFRIPADRVGELGEQTEIYLKV